MMQSGLFLFNAMCDCSSPRGCNTRPTFCLGSIEYCLAPYELKVGVRTQRQISSLYGGAPVGAAQCLVKQLHELIEVQVPITIHVHEFKENLHIGGAVAPLCQTFPEREDFLNYLLVIQRFAMENAHTCLIQVCRFRPLN